MATVVITLLVGFVGGICGGVFLNYCAWAQIEGEHGSDRGV